MSESFDLERPEHFTAGTVGPPGQRVFYLQACEGETLVTLKVEKEQVGALADYLAGFLPRLPGKPAAGETAPMLLEPIRPAWDVGALGVGYDEANDRVVIVANEAVESGDDEDDGGEAAAAASEGAPEVAETAGEPEAAAGATARLHVTRPQAAAFVERARALVKAGRPTCRVCGQPIDPAGHLCPRRNGHAP